MRRRLSQPAVAEKVGISRTTLANIERGTAYVAGSQQPYRSTPHTLAAIALAVGEDPVEIVKAAGLDPELIPWDVVQDTPEPGDGTVAVLILRSGVSDEELVARVRRALDEIRRQS